jgi:hypothetical protein
MGGWKYKGDVGERTRSVNTTDEIFNSSYQTYLGGSSGRREVHPTLNIFGKNRECLPNAQNPNPTPIFFAMDVTRSRGNDVKIIFAKLPMFIGQIDMHNYIPDPTLCFGCFGDGQYIDGNRGDEAPIQVGQFEADNRLDDQLAKMWLEEGGGGNGRENSELMACFAARHTILEANRRGRKGYFFLSTDEAPYPAVSKYMVKKWIGDDLVADIPTSQIFKELQEKYHVFLIYPQKDWKDRVDDVNAEMKRRVVEAGGLYDGVDVRASLLWFNYNDLDIHIIDPCGHHIFYGSNCKNNGHSPASCGGFLDVDANAGGGKTRKPVENIRWPKGCAPKGHYRVFVRTYAFHENSHEGSKYQAEVQIGSKVLQFEGKMPDRKVGEESDQLIYEFDYDPSMNEPIIEKGDQYAAYADETILAQWKALVPEENILICKPNGIVDAMLGAIAMTEDQNRTLESYLKDMEERGQDDARIKDIKRALSGIEEKRGGLVDVPTTIPTEKKKTKNKTRKI